MHQLMHVSYRITTELPYTPFLFLNSSNSCCLKHVLPHLCFDTLGYVLPSPIQQLPTILTFQYSYLYTCWLWKYSTYKTCSSTITKTKLSKILVKLCSILINWSIDLQVLHLQSIYIFIFFFVFVFYQLPH